MDDFVILERSKNFLLPRDQKVAATIGVGRRFTSWLEDCEFRWPKIEDGAMRLSAAQFSALQRC